MDAVYGKSSQKMDDFGVPPMAMETPIYKPLYAKREQHIHETILVHLLYRCCRWNEMRAQGVRKIQ